MKVILVKIAMNHYNIEDKSINDKEIFYFNLKRGFLGSCGFCCIIYAIKTINLSEAISLLFMSSVWYF